MRAACLVLVGIFAALLGAGVARADVPTNTDLPTITGDARVGNTLQSWDGNWSDDPASYEHQWQRCSGVCSDIIGATDWSYTLTLADLDQQIVLTVTADNSDGSTSASSEPTDSVGPEPAVEAPVNVSPPTLQAPPQGRATAGFSPSDNGGAAVDVGEWSGYPDPSFALQWERCDLSGDSCVAIPGATNWWYGLSVADNGNTLRAAVTGTNQAGSATALTEASEPIPDPPRTQASFNDASPSQWWYGYPGEEITAHLNITGGAPIENTRFEWTLCTTPRRLFSWDSQQCRTEEVQNPSADESYTIESDIRWGFARWWVTNSWGEDSSMTVFDTEGPRDSQSFGPGPEGAPPVSISPPRIEGADTVGNTLSVNTGDWGGLDLTPDIQWFRCSATCTSVSTDSNYVASEADLGQSLKVVVTMTNTVGSATAESALTPAVLDEAELQTLAEDYRPALLFDDGEHYRPITVASLLSEKLDNGDPAHKLQARYLPTLTDEFVASVDGLGNGPTGLLQPTGDSSTFEPILAITNFGSGTAEDYYAPDCPRLDPTFDSSAALRDCGDDPGIYYDFGQSAAGYRFIDYWFFYRYNPVTDDSHEGDWEGVTVVLNPDPTLAPSVAGVIFWAHGFGFYRPNLEGVMEWCTGSAPTQASCSVTSTSHHVADFVALGSHASYEYRCTDEHCENPAHSLPGGYDVIENRHGGEAAWTEGSSAAIIPISDMAGNPTADWVTWPGQWGSSIGNPIGAGKSPYSPGNQVPYECTTHGWSCDTQGKLQEPPSWLQMASSSTASPTKPPFVFAECSTYLDPGLAAGACSPSQLKPAIAAGKTKRHGSFEIRIRNRRGGSSRGVAQVIGGPVGIGTKAVLLGTPAADETVVVNVEIGRKVYGIELTQLTMHSRAYATVVLNSAKPRLELHGVHATQRVFLWGA